MARSIGQSSGSMLAPGTSAMWEILPFPYADGGALSVRSMATTTGSMRTRLNEAERRERADAAALQGPVFSAFRPDEPTNILHVQSTRNNVIMSYTDFKTGNKVMRTITAGTDKDFKKSNRSSYEAAHQAALKMFGAIKEQAGRPMSTRMVVAFKGMFGQGREAVSAALLGPEGVDIRKLVVRVEDRTPIKIGGTRAKRPRRL
jgi:small subunit ribosomal protein S11